MSDQPGKPDPTDPIARFFADMAGQDPQALADLLKSMGVLDVDPQLLQSMLNQAQDLLAAPSESGSVNWAIVQKTAHQVIAERHKITHVQNAPSQNQSHLNAADAEPEVTARHVDDAVRLADSWLTEHTMFPAAGARSSSWTATEWVNGTLPVWQKIIEPVADSAASAMAEALHRQTPPELSAHVSMFTGGDSLAMMRRIGASAFGFQVGQAIGTLAGDVMSGTEIGLPLAPDGTVVLLPQAISAFGNGLEISTDDLLLYIALREAARARLFSHVSWLSAALLDAVAQYARGISIDTARIEEAVQHVDLQDPRALQDAFASGVFEPVRSPVQHATLHRLETMLALIEGWVDVVAHAAAEPIPTREHLRESVRRRRATGGPAERTFATLVGLELRPRRLRDATALWTLMSQDDTAAARDQVWRHPDLLPTAADLDDPLGYRERAEDAAHHNRDFEQELQEILDTSRPDSSGSDTQP
ncbi:MAG: zinc-dependent metalloprotease [Actinomycetota bacterium]